MKVHPESMYSTDFFKNLKVDDSEYYNIHVINLKSSKYDSIFYNSEFGFLRFVSTEGKLDIVLDR
jgi:hypothetical protein